ncbi:hypothetical protein AOLI_G00237920 [Acnodon oligacanthus]
MFSDQIVSALKELPDVVKTLKELVAAVKVPPASPTLSCSTSSSDLQPIASAPVEMILFYHTSLGPLQQMSGLSSEESATMIAIQTEFKKVIKASKDCC